MAIVNTAKEGTAFKRHCLKTGLSSVKEMPCSGMQIPAAPGCCAESNQARCMEKGYVAATRPTSHRSLGLLKSDIWVLLEFTMEPEIC